MVMMEADAFILLGASPRSQLSYFFKKEENMKNKRGLQRISFIGFLVLLAFMFAFTPAADAKKIKLRAISFLPVQVTVVKTLGMYADKVNARAKGELEIKWLGGPEVIPLPALAEAVIKGRVDIAYNVGMLFADKIPGVAGIAFSPFTPMEERKNGIYEWIAGQFRKGNLHYLGRSKTDMPFYTFTNFPVKTLNDFKGKQIGALDFSMGFFKALGASVVNVPKTDWYTSVQRGVVDGYMLPPGNMVRYKLQELTKYVIDHGISTNHEVIVMNLKKWNSLPQHLQKLMTDAAIELEYDMKDFFIKETARSRKVIKGAGVQFLKLSPEEAKKYMDIFRDSVWKDFEEMVGPEIAAETKKVMSK